MYVSREPLIHQLGGSTTYALGIIAALKAKGADVSILTTNAYSCSPLLWFRAAAPLPADVTLEAPGFVRFGKLYLNLFSAGAWARAFSRVGVRFPAMRPLAKFVERLFGGGLYTNAWDLTPPTRKEKAAAKRAVERHNATTVIVNYDFWAPLLQELAGSGRKRVIVMHDLLSARTRAFLEAGTPLDSPHVGEAEEMQWLSSADLVLAAQPREAEYIRKQISVPVLVAPLPYTAKKLSGEPAPETCLFVGANIPPNQTGIRWFLDEVWPRVRTANSNATLALVGSICSFVEDGLPGVLKLNVVPTIDNEYARACVCVVPLLIGSGIKIKLIEALSFGKAVVSTSTGVQGVEEWAPRVVDVTDDAAEFASAVSHLLQDASARKAREAVVAAAFQQHLVSATAFGPDFIASVL